MSRSHTAYRTRHNIRSRAWRSVISRDACPPRIYSHAAGDALGHRARRATGRCRTSSMRGEFITWCTTRCALHGRHRKSVWEVVQAFGRAVSAKSYNFDGSTAFVAEPAPVASRFQRHIVENFIHQHDRISMCHVDLQ